MSIGTIWRCLLYLHVVLLAKTVTSADSIYKTDNSVYTNRVKRESGTEDYMGTVDNVKRSRQQRSLTDYGYGSRVHAGTNMAHLTLGDSVYGIYGPGKRSTGGRFDTVMLRLGNGGYDTRTALKEQLLNRLEDAYEQKYTPFEQSVEDGYPTEGFYSESDFDGAANDRTEDIESDSYSPFVATKRGTLFHRLFRGYSGDSGYGSRISAGNQVASDREAYNSVFGGWGPGKKKRSVPSMQSEQ